MSRNPLFALSLMLGMALSSSAEDPTAALRIFTEPNGMRFFVDGQPYKTAQVFLWPVGSKHTVLVETEQQIFAGTRTKFSTWSASTSTLALNSESRTITASPNITYVKPALTD